MSKEGEQFQVVVRRFQERSEGKMSVVDDVIAADRTEQVSGGEGIDTGLLSRHTQVHRSIVYISYIGYCLIMLHVLCYRPANSGGSREPGSQ